MTAAGETRRAAAETASETTPLLPGPNAPDGALAGGHSPAVQAGGGGTGAGDPAPVEQKGNAYMAKLLPALAIGVFLVAMDQTLTIATYGKMGSDLNALNSTSWIATSYFLTLTTFQPLYGRLSDIFGRKECLLFAYSVFGLGCLGCGLAGDIVQLCVARAVAGVGGGGMNAVVSILMTDLVPLRDRGLWQGYINMVYAAGVASGAPIGGLLADSLGWRVAFAGQFPLAVLAWLAVFWVLDLPRADAAHWTAKLRRVDFLGALALSAAAFVLLWGLDNGANAGWGRLVTVVPLALAPVLFGLFVFIEVRVAASPFAPGRVILDPPLLAAYGANFFGLASQMGVMFFIAMFYQAAMALSATQSGALFVPSTFFGLTGSLGAGLLIRKTGKFYGLSLVGYSVMMLGLVPLVLFSGAAVKSVTGVVIGMTIMSLGGSISITTTLIAIIANAPPEETAVAVACSYLFRSLGSTIGISLSTAVLQQVLRMQLTARLNDGGQAADIEEHVRQSLDYIWTLPPAVADIVRDCYAVATVWAFLPSAVLAVLCLMSTYFIREKRLDR